jgi:membrane protein YqaA with SNARE-associated domain
MTGLSLKVPARPRLATRIARGLVARRGSLEWDAAIRGTGLLALAAIPALLWLPRAGDLAVFMLATIWCHGPLSPLLPATFEPILMHFGRLYHPMVIALLGTVGNMYIEYFNYRLYGGVLRLEALERMNGAVGRGRLMRWFEWSPFFAVWFGTVTPIPDWLGRIVASVAEYPQGRYLLAFGLGRFPRFLLFASLGAWLTLSTPIVVVATVGTLAVAAAVALFKWLQLRRAGTGQEPPNRGTRPGSRGTPDCRELCNALPNPPGRPHQRQALSRNSLS